MPKGQPDTEDMKDSPCRTLLRYDFGGDTRAAVLAFSTTRHSPFVLSAGEEREMGAYAAFNVTHYCGDSPARVARNLAWLADELGVETERIVLPRQTHTANVACVDDALLRLAPEERGMRLDGVDALVTDVPRVCVGVSTADCVPVLLFDPVRRAVAAVHAGWRGTVARITSRAVEAMGTRYGTRPADLRAVIGPSISPEAFEVGGEVVDAFARAGFDTARLSRRYPALRREEAGQEKPHIDLWAANAMLLEEAGVPLAAIQVAGVCTYARCGDFFSARRLGIHSGRVFTAVMLK